MTGQGGVPRWFVVDARVDEGELDVLSGRLWAIGVAGIEERSTDGGLQLVVSVDPDRLDEVTVALGARLLGVREARADEGLDGWRSWARPTRVGGLVIEPAWLAQSEARDDAATLRIDPGHAFGSGAHVTTRLALALLQQIELRDRTVLDVGTGSGVLSIAAAVLGARQVVGIDVDELARNVARANVVANEVGAIVEIADGSVDELDEEFAVVVANIDASSLIGSAASIAARLARDGTLILSGMLAEHGPDVTAAFPDVAFGEQLSEQGWLAAAGQWRLVS